MMMSPGMMGGYGYGGPYSGGSDLTKEQAEKIDKIRDDLAKKETPLLQQIFEEKRKLQDMYSSGADPSALDQAYRKTTDLERQVFNARADAQKRMNAALTKEQRERMQPCGAATATTCGTGIKPRRLWAVRLLKGWSPTSPGSRITYQKLACHKSANLSPYGTMDNQENSHTKNASR